MKRLLIFAALALAACSTPPAVKETVVVDRPVSVLEKPFTAAEIPAVPAPLGKRPADLGQAADQLLAKVCEFVSYAERANPLLRLGAGLPTGPALAFPECSEAD